MGLVSGRPSNLLHRYFGKAVGDSSLTGLSPGWQVGGVVIDNYSGSWLLLQPAYVLVPPYVTGWATPLVPANATVEVTYVPGPGGFLGTTAGAPAVVTLFANPVAASPGVPFTATQAAPTLAVLNSFTAYNTNTTLRAGIANQRIRLYSVLIEPNTDHQGANPLSWQLVLAFGAGTALTSPIYSGRVGRTPAPVIFERGLDGPLGANINGAILELWTSAGTGIAGTIAQPTITTYSEVI